MLACLNWGGKYMFSPILPHLALYHDSIPYAADFLSFWKFNSRHTSQIGQKNLTWLIFSHTHPWPLFFSRILPYQKKRAQNRKWKPHFSVMSSHSELQPHRKPTSSIFQNGLIGILQTQSRALNETKPGLGFFPSYIHQKETLPQATTQHKPLVLKTALWPFFKNLPATSNSRRTKAGLAWGNLFQHFLS